MLLTIWQTIVCRATTLPDELVAAGIPRSNRIDQVYEYGFDIGGPIVKDKLFAWGAYRRNQIDLFTRNFNAFTRSPFRTKRS